MPQTETIEVHTGATVSIEHVKSLSTGGARFDIETDDGRKWRVDVSKSGSNTDVVTSWENGVLTDIEVPDWMDHVLARLSGAA